MICVDGYKAFKGTMLITPKNTAIEPFTLFGQWLYKPEYGCWYGCGHSFVEDICTIISED